MVIDPKTPVSIQQHHKNSTRLNNLLRWLLEPPDSLPEPQRLQGRWLSGLLLLFGLGMLLALVLPIPGFHGAGQSPIFVASFVLWGLAYGLSRTKYYTWPAR